MLRIVILISALAVAAACAPTFAATTYPATPTVVPTQSAEPSAPEGKKLGCAASPEYLEAANAEAQGATHEHGTAPAVSTGPKVVFKLTTAEDAPTILRFVTNYLAVEPTAKVAVVGYSDGINFMLQGAQDATGKPYADQLAALSARGVAFKVCNNTLRARNLTAAAVSTLATVVPGAVNEIIRLQTKEGYAYFQN